MALWFPGRVDSSFPPGVILNSAVAQKVGVWFQRAFAPVPEPIHARRVRIEALRTWRLDEPLGLHMVCSRAGNRRMIRGA